MEKPNEYISAQPIESAKTIEVLEDIDGLFKESEEGNVLKREYTRFQIRYLESVELQQDGVLEFLYEEKDQLGTVLEKLSIRVKYDEHKDEWWIVKGEIVIKETENGYKSYLEDITFDEFISSFYMTMLLEVELRSAKPKHVNSAQQL